jgi:carbamate kinase
LETIVIAIGGNAISDPSHMKGNRSQQARIAKVARSIAEVYSPKTRIIITHGNGPQVGVELERNEIASGSVSELPLYYLTAETQAVIGSEIETHLKRELAALGKKVGVYTVISHVVVDKKDADFKNPTKPIGPFLRKEALDEALKNGKFKYVETSNGYRRVVPSPKPKRIVEFEAIYNLSRSGIVIACGGGGIPVTDQQNRYKGVNAVIDKDRTATLLSNALKADKMIILTDADFLYTEYARRKGAIKHIKASILEIILDKFEQGSMRPKVEACIDYIKAGGKEAYIGNVYELSNILKGSSGTMVTR